ncbi:pentapeptide repeat-containing protein (plasmid) [Nocardia sp. NBC_01377]
MATEGDDIFRIEFDPHFTPTRSSRAVVVARQAFQVAGFRRLPLLAAIVAAVVGGVGVGLMAMWLLPSVIQTSSKPADPIDITRLALGITAGVGGIVALVVAYRRQSDIEVSRFIERFGAAAAQLGDSDAAVRMAGVYAMAGTADESRGLRRQQCIDVLCGYLRLPYSPEFGANHRAQLVMKRTNTTPAGTTVEEAEHLQYRHNDRHVRRAVVQVIATHLRENAEYSWSTHGFDFREVEFERADFRGAVFGGPAWFGDARFTGEAWFDGARFQGTARFDRVRFTGAARFERAAFAGGVLFTGATFAAGGSFRHVDFGSRPATFENSFPLTSPRPRFDWDNDVSMKPANVTPDHWPTTPAAG